jgi:hypothetical protein
MSGIETMGSSYPINLSKNRPLKPIPIFVEVKTAAYGVSQLTNQFGTIGIGI